MTSQSDPELPAVLVVGAVLVDDLDRPQRLLAARRTRPAALAGYWEFPGGKVEPGELPRPALARELAEELGIDAMIGAEVNGTGQTDPVPAGWPLPGGARLRLFLAHSPDQPQPLDGTHDELRWLESDTITDVDWLPADADAVRVVSELLAAQPA